MRTEITEKPELRSKQDARLLHGVFCYKDRATNPSRTYDTWAGKCICHHAVWHSCPDKNLGFEIFSSLPQFSEVKTSKEDEIISLLTEIRDLLKSK